MIAVCFALLAATAYGASDFAGGLASRRQHFAVVNLLGQVLACAVLVAAGLLSGGSLSVATCGWGVLAGLGSGVGTLALYRGLANGRMAVVAPLSAGVAAVLPVLCGYLIGNSPSMAADAGVIVALPAVVLISTTGARSAGAMSSSARDGIVAGIGFGVLFIALSRTAADAGMWPSAVSATTSLVLVAAVAPPTLARGWRMPRRDAGIAALSGVLGAAGTTMFLVASRSGMLAIVSVITSLYPAATVLLARGTLREPVGRLQVAGLGMAALGVTLIAAG